MGCWLCVNIAAGRADGMIELALLAIGSSQFMFVPSSNRVPLLCSASSCHLNSIPSIVSESLPIVIHRSQARIKGLLLRGAPPEVPTTRSLPTISFPCRFSK